MADPTALETYLGLPNGNPDADLLVSMTARATAIFQKRTGRIFTAPAEASKYMHMVNDVEGNVLWLPSDLYSITKVTNGDGTEVTSGQYVTEPDDPPYKRIVLRSSANIEWTTPVSGDPERAIEVKGVWCYSSTPPEDVAWAIVRLAAFLYRQKESNADTDRAIRTPDGSIIMPSKLPADVQSVIDDYREVTIR